MGRGKVHMKPINDIKKRKFTFKTRKDGLIKKAFEITTLCDVKLSMIICSDHQQEPQIFPKDPLKFNSMIDLYKRQQIMNPAKIQYYSLSDFFNERKIKIDKELAKAKKKNMEAKYPTWFDFLNNFSEAQLRESGFGLDRKIDLVKRKIESLKIPKIQNLDHHVFYPGTLLDVHSSFVTPLINPSPLPMTTPMNYSDLVFDPAPLFTDQNNYIMQPTNHKSEVLKLQMNKNDDQWYDNENFSLQPQSPIMIPMSYNDLVFADQNNFIMQSENPNLENLKFWLQPEIPELPPFMHMNPVSTSESSSQMTEYDAGANGIGHHFLV